MFLTESSTSSSKESLRTSSRKVSKIPQTSEVLVSENSKISLFVRKTMTEHTNRAKEYKYSDAFVSSAAGEQKREAQLTSFIKVLVSNRHYLLWGCMQVVRYM